MCNASNKEMKFKKILPYLKHHCLVKCGNPASPEAVCSGDLESWHFLRAPLDSVTGQLISVHTSKRKRVS